MLAGTLLSPPIQSFTPLFPNLGNLKTCERQLPEIPSQRTFWEFILFIYFIEFIWASISQEITLGDIQN